MKKRIIPFFIVSLLVSILIIQNFSGNQFISRVVAEEDWEEDITIFPYGTMVYPSIRNWTNDLEGYFEDVRLYFMSFTKIDLVENYTIAGNT